MVNILGFTSSSVLYYIAKFLKSVPHYTYSLTDFYVTVSVACYDVIDTAELLFNTQKYSFRDCIA